MRDLLLAQTIRNGIPGALLGEVDSGLLIGNKTGTWPGAQHDVAFVEAQSGAYVIAILTDGSYEGWLALHRVVPEVHAALSD
ncbi:MAG: serine hydrolase [Dehalococcoidia bacterium]|nr:serine hydrolase [Dehalococcoidia bacterium]